MGIEENKALVRQWLKSHEGVSNVELLAPDHVYHNMRPGAPQGREGARAGLELLHKAFSDWIWNIEDMVAEGDKVAVRGTVRFKHTGDFRGIKATGKEISISIIQIWTIRNGKLGDLWEQNDLIQQLGVIPKPGG